jgi:sulfatase modifying factor 1
MHHVPGGEFIMGSDRYYPEERPARRVRVNSFWIDDHPVTNRQFAAFVEATGYQTFAETTPDLSRYPGLKPGLARAGSLVFAAPSGPVNLEDPSQWWKFCLGACWRSPLGEGSSIAGIEDHPAVHIAYCDAQAYAAWVNKALPTEAEWEYAAQGGLEHAEFAWGDELSPGGAMLANLWQGPFPYRNDCLDGWERTSPVGAFPPNGFGLYDMIGNVWEWTDDWFGVAADHAACCVPVNPRGAREQESYDPAIPAHHVGRKVIKGGSYLCAPNYCQRYRPPARTPQPVDTTTGHVGFRCVVRNDGR